MAAERRSGCPVSISLELLGDRWSLLIVRDLMVRGCRTFKDFQSSSEAIASNILANRLKKLESSGIVARERDQGADARRVQYRLTEKGIGLAPLLLELFIWGARHNETAAPEELIRQIRENPKAMVEEVRRRWEQRDPTPLVPSFTSKKATAKVAKRRSTR